MSRTHSLCCQEPEARATFLMTPAACTMSHQCMRTRHWAARCNTWLLIKLTPRGVVFLLFVMSVSCAQVCTSRSGLPCRYMAARQAAMDGERAQAMASYMDQQGLCPCNGRPFMPLLVTAAVHKVCHKSLDLCHCCYPQDLPQLS